MQKWLLLLLLSTKCFCAVAQERLNISGFVRDSLNAPIPFAQVYVQKTDSSSIIAYGSTYSEGAFKFSAPMLKNFIVKANVLGFEAKVIRFENNDKTAIVANFNLNPKTFTLKETIVKANSTIQKSDTTTFSADKFRDSTDRTLEQVLAKLPGVEVDKNTGAITVQGKSIKKILFEGDDLTGRNYQLLSQNMPADAIDKIQLIDKFVENKQLKGIKNSEDIVINVTLKENKRYLLFGTSDIGAGNDDRYLGTFNIIGAFRKFKTLTFAGYNSVGRRSSADLLNRLDYKEEGEAEAQHALLKSTNNSIINFGDAPSLGINSQSLRFNKELKAASLFTYRPTKTLLLKGGINFTNDAVTSFVSNDQKFLLADSSFVLTEQIINQSKPTIVETHFDAQLDASDKLLLRYVFDARKSLINNSAQTLSNANNIANVLNTDILSFANTFDLTQRLNDKQALTVNASYIKDDNKQNYTLHQVLPRNAPLLNSSVDALTQNIARPLSYYAFNAQWFYANNGLQLAIYSGFVQRDEKINSQLNAFNKNSEVALPDSFANNTVFNQKNYYVGLNFKKIIYGISYGIDISGGVQNTVIENRLSKSGLYVLPTLQLQKRFSERSNLLFSYGFNVGLPQTTNLANGYILKDYRNLSRGSSTFVTQNSNTFVAYYKFGNFEDRSTFYANIFYTNNNGGYRSAFTINSDYNLSTQIENFLPSNSTSVRIGLDRYLSNIHWRIKLIPSLSWSSFQNSLNGSDIRKTDAVTKSLELSIKSGYLKWFNFNAGSTYSVSENTTTVSNLENTNGNQSVGGFLDFTLHFNMKVFCRLDNEVYSFKQSTENTWQKYYFSNASITYDAQMNKLDFSLEVKNILNTTEFINSSVTDYYTLINRVRLLPRYVLFSVNYRF